MAKELSGTLPSRTLEFSVVNSIPVKIESTGALIYCTTTNRYLFLLRNGSKFSNTWSIAGGKVEVGESTIQALTRELQEEIGLDISFYKLIPLETYTADNQNFVYHTFILVVDQEFIPVLNKEHKGYAWTEIEHVPRPLHPGLFKTLHIEEINKKIKAIEKSIVKNCSMAVS